MHGKAPVYICLWGQLSHQHEHMKCHTPTPRLGWIAPLPICGCAAAAAGRKPAVHSRKASCRRLPQQCSAHVIPRLVCLPNAAILLLLCSQSSLQFNILVLSSSRTCLLMQRACQWPACLLMYCCTVCVHGMWPAALCGQQPATHAQRAHVTGDDAQGEAADTCVRCCTR